MPPAGVWGPPIWTLFHTLAAKIREDKFNEIGHELFPSGGGLKKEGV